MLAMEHFNCSFSFTEINIFIFNISLHLVTIHHGINLNFSFGIAFNSAVDKMHLAEFYSSVLALILNLVSLVLRGMEEFRSIKVFSEGRDAVSGSQICVVF